MLPTCHLNNGWHRNARHRRCKRSLPMISAQQTHSPREQQPSLANCIHHRGVSQRRLTRPSARQKRYGTELSSKHSYASQHAVMALSLRVVGQQERCKRAFFATVTTLSASMMSSKRGSIQVRASAILKTNIYCGSMVTSGCAAALQYTVTKFPSLLDTQMTSRLINSRHYQRLDPFVIRNEKVWLLAQLSCPPQQLAKHLWVGARIRESRSQN